jgi:hypothetical protein
MFSSIPCIIAQYNILQRVKSCSECTSTTESTAQKWLVKLHVTSDRETILEPNDISSALTL